MTKTNTNRVEHFRTVFTELAESGNRRMLNRNTFISSGGESEEWDEYDVRMNQLESWARKMCEYLFNPIDGEYEVGKEERAKFLDECRDKILTIEKAIFALFRTDETRAFWHVTKHDASYIAGMADEFMVKRNVNRGETINRVHSPATHQTFRKRFESHLCTKIMEESVMDGNRAEYLRQEGKLMRGISSAESELEDLREKLAPYEADLEDPKNQEPSLQRYITKIANKQKAEIAKVMKRKKGLEDKLAHLREQYPEGTMHEPSLAEIQAQADSQKGKDEARRNEKELKALRAKKVSQMKKDELVRELTLAEVEFDEGLGKPALKLLVKDERALAQAKNVPEPQVAQA